jgi:hypothetical protein
MTKILNQATRAAHTAKLANKNNVQRYSRYPVYDSQFWEHIFKSARHSETARKVLDEMSVLEDEPCIENDRVWRNVSVAKSIASVTLRK